jgi:hypothetical protein
MTKAQKAGTVAQVVEFFPSMHKALSSNLRRTGKKFMDFLVQKNLYAHPGSIHYEQ